MPTFSFPLFDCSPDEAVEALIQRFTLTPPTRKLDITDATGHILASPCLAARDVPAFDNSAMDGVVIRKSDWDNGLRVFPVVGEIPPELTTPPPLQSGTAMRIMTGAPVPEHGELIIPVELLDDTGSEVTVKELPGKNPIRKKGEGYNTGEQVLEQGTLIRPYEAGLMIESGNSECTVFEPLVVGVQVTGSEVGEAMNTNGPVITQLLNNLPGVTPKEYPVLEDDPEVIHSRMNQLRDECDVILTTGGISAGKFDYLPDILEQNGAELLIRKVNQKPGKPFTSYDWKGTPVCCLPGNPISAVFTFEWYVQQLLASLNNLGKTTISAEVAERESALINRGGKHLFVPGQLSYREGRILVSAEPVMKSHLMQLYKDADCYVHLKPGTQYQTGDLIEVMPFAGS